MNFRLKAPSFRYRISAHAQSVPAPKPWQEFLRRKLLGPSRTRDIREVHHLAPFLDVCEGLVVSRSSRNQKPSLTAQTHRHSAGGDRHAQFLRRNHIEPWAGSIASSDIRAFLSEPGMRRRSFHIETPDRSTPGLPTSHTVRQKNCAPGSLNDFVPRGSSFYVETGLATP